VVPVAVEFDGTFLWVGGGATVRKTRKFRNVASGNAKVALVFDDLATRMTLRSRGEPSGFANVAAPVMAAAMRRANNHDLAALKRLLEKSEPA